MTMKIKPSPHLCAKPEPEIRIERGREEGEEERGRDEGGRDRQTKRQRTHNVVVIYIAHHSSS